MTYLFFMLEKRLITDKTHGKVGGIRLRLRSRIGYETHILVSSPRTCIALYATYLDVGHGADGLAGGCVSIALAIDIETIPVELHGEIGGGQNNVCAHDIALPSYEHVYLERLRGTSIVKVYMCAVPLRCVAAKRQYVLQLPVHTTRTQIDDGSEGMLGKVYIGSGGEWLAIGNVVLPQTLNVVCTKNDVWNKKPQQYDKGQKGFTGVGYHCGKQMFLFS